MPIFEVVSVVWFVLFVVYFVFLFEFTHHDFRLELAAAVGLAGDSVQGVDCVFAGVFIILVEFVGDVF